MLMVYLRLFSPNEQNERMSKWEKWTNEQMSKCFYSFKKMSTHFYYKMSEMSKWVNEQNIHMSKFGVKWAPEILIYYKNTPGCIMLMVHPGVSCSWYTRVYHEWTRILGSNGMTFISHMGDQSSNIGRSKVSILLGRGVWGLLGLLVRGSARG